MTQSIAASGDHVPSVPWYGTFTGLALLYLYSSKYVPDAILVPVAALYLIIGALRFNTRGLVFSIAACVLLPLQAFVHGGEIDSPGQIFHLLALLAVFLALDDAQFAPDTLIGFCKATTIINLTLLALSWVPQVAEIVEWTNDSSIAVLPEPSFVALYSTLNFYVLTRSGNRGYAYANLLPLVASFSFSGFIGFALLGFVYFKQSWRMILRGAAMLLMSLGLLYILSPDTITSMLVARTVNSVSGGNDESVNLRIFAPLDLIKTVANGRDNLTLFTGLGVGNVERSIYYRQTELPHYWRASGQRSVEPDSVIAFAVAAFGVPVAIVLGLYICGISLPRACPPEYSVVYWYLWLICVFTGLFISAHFFIWIYLLRQVRNIAETSAASTKTTVPS
jgi:hypothetical protein